MRASQRETVLQVAIIVAVAGVVMFTNLGGPLLWDRDEPRNAGCALEMLARGDWVTPVFNAELRTHKPVLLYWFIMSAYSLLGVSEFSARFWSATLAVGTALCTYTIGRRLFNPQAGMWAGVIIATALMFDVAGRAATPDSTLIFFSTLAIALYVQGAFRESPAGGWLVDEGRPFFPSWPRATVMYAVMGVAMLAKGPVGLILPTAVLGMFLLVVRLPVLPEAAATSFAQRWRRRARNVIRVANPIHFLQTAWSMRPLTALAASLAVAVPWYLWVGLRTDGEFLRGFFLEHNVSRAMSTMEGHSGSVLFYPLAILVGFFPWSVFAGPVLLDGIRNGRSDAKYRAGYVLAACWVGVYVGLFTLARTKLPSYVTPCYPALAIATGCFVQRWTSHSLRVSRHWFRASLGIQAAVGLVLVIALPIAARVFLPGEEWLGIVGLAPLVGGLAALWLHERSEDRRAALAFATSAVLLMTLLSAVVADRVSRHQRNGELLAAIDKTGAARVASFGLLEPSWVFYGRRAVDELSDPDVGSPMPAWINQDGRWVPKPTISVADLEVDEPVLIITTERHAELLREKLPADFGILARAPYFLKKGDLVVVGPTSAGSLARQPRTSSGEIPR